MKYYLLTAILFTSCLISAAELSKNEMKRLRDVSIGGTRIDDWRNDDREEFLVLEISIAHAPEDPREFDMSRFRVRLAVELTDKQKNKYVVQFTGSPTPDYPYEYLGEDFWKFYMPEGDLERLKVSAYVIQYGIMSGAEFVSLSEDEKDAKRMQAGLTAGTTLLFPGECYMKHYYIYDDVTSGTMESPAKKVKAIKE